MDREPRFGRLLHRGVAVDVIRVTVRIKDLNDL
jgi:hypothetical protein